MLNKKANDFSEKSLKEYSLKRLVVLQNVYLNSINLGLGNDNDIVMALEGITCLRVINKVILKKINEKKHGKVQSI